MEKITLLPFVVSAVLVSQNVTAADPSEIRLRAPQAPLSYGLPNVIIVNPTLEENDFEIRTSGAHYFKRAITSTKPRITSSEKFIPLPGATTNITIPPGKAALVNVAFTAESACSEPGSPAPDWCEVRIMVDGVEAAPAASTFAPDTYAFDSTDRGSESNASWESHALDRHKCVYNKSDTAKVVPINVDWKVTNFDGGTAPSFWLDDWSLTVELANGCRKVNGKF
jgi:hypothetical protein